MRDPARLRLPAATPSGWLLFCARSCESRRHSAPGLCVPPKDRRNALAGLGIVIAGSIVRRSNDLMWYYAVRRIMLAIPIALGVTIIVAGATAWKPSRSPSRGRKARSCPMPSVGLDCQGWRILRRRIRRGPGTRARPGVSRRAQARPRPPRRFRHRRSGTVRFDDVAGAPETYGKGGAERTPGGPGRA